MPLLHSLLARYWLAGRCLTLRCLTLHRQTLHRLTLHRLAAARKHGALRRLRGALRRLRRALLACHRQARLLAPGLIVPAVVLLAAAQRHATPDAARKTVSGAVRRKAAGRHTCWRKPARLHAGGLQPVAMHARTLTRQAACLASWQSMGGRSLSVQPAGRQAVARHRAAMLADIMRTYTALRCEPAVLAATVMRPGRLLTNVLAATVLAATVLAATGRITHLPSRNGLDVRR